MVLRKKDDNSSNSKEIESKPNATANRPKETASKPRGTEKKKKILLIPKAIKRNVAFVIKKSIEPKEVLLLSVHEEVHKMV
jgi:hypothetical protein